MELSKKWITFSIQQLKREVPIYPRGNKKRKQPIQFQQISLFPSFP